MGKDLKMKNLLIAVMMVFSAQAENLSSPNAIDTQVQDSQPGAIVLPPLSAAEKAKKRYIIVKLDDFGSGPAESALYPKGLKDESFAAFGRILDQLEKDGCTFVTHSTFHYQSRAIEVKNKEI
jgi:hypothetical protein